MTDEIELFSDIDDVVETPVIVKEKKVKPIKIDEPEVTPEEVAEVAASIEKRKVEDGEYNVLVAKIEKATGAKVISRVGSVATFNKGHDVCVNLKNGFDNCIRGMLSLGIHVN